MTTASKELNTNLLRARWMLGRETQFHPLSKTIDSILPAGMRVIQFAHTGNNTLWIAFRGSPRDTAERFLDDLEIALQTDQTNKSFIRKEDKVLYAFRETFSYQDTHVDIDLYYTPGSEACEGEAAGV